MSLYLWAIVTDTRFFTILRVKRQPKTKFDECCTAEQSQTTHLSNYSHQGFKRVLNRLDKSQVSSENKNTI